MLHVLFCLLFRTRFSFNWKYAHGQNGPLYPRPDINKRSSEAARRLRSYFVVASHNEYSRTRKPTALITDLTEMRSHQGYGLTRGLSIRRLHSVFLDVSIEYLYTRKPNAFIPILNKTRRAIDATV